MPMIDPFSPNAFSLQTLTAAINETKYQPGRLGELGWFKAQGLSTLTANIESREGVLSIVDPKPRGSDGTPLAAAGDRKLLPFIVPHMPQRDTLLADEVQGVRAFGTESQAEALQMRLNEKLARLRQNIEYTMEYHRMQAVQGNYIDVNGATTSLFTTFGVSQETKSMAFNASTSSKQREKALEVLELIEAQLDGVPFSGIRVLCSSGFWKALIEDKDLKDTYLNHMQAAELRRDPRMAFEYNGLTYERYRGTSAVGITADAAYAVPDGVPNLFLTRFAPADYNETVNTIGLPYYAKSEPLKFGKGYEIEAQSNALNICTRPAAIIKLTKA